MKERNPVSSKKAQAIVEDLMTTAYESYLDFNTQIYKQSEVP